MKIGIYGGTFNPPHLGHMAAARGVCDALKLDRLLIIPARIPPHKTLPAHSASTAQRLEMVSLMADRLGCAAKASASDIELRREGPSYTSDTLRALHRQYPKDELWLLVGTDMFLSLHEWNQPEMITSLAGIAAFGRATGDEEALRAQKRRLKRTFGARVKLISLPELIEVSSTQVRNLLPQGGGQDLLDQSIYGYILRQRLYGLDRDLTHLSLDDLRAASYSMVRAKRLPHIRGTEEEAALLARRWGVNEDDARRAAILHDCTKYWSFEQQLHYCAECGILLDQTEQSTPALLHAKTGAEVARRVFGMSDEICSAIRWHTTGRADLTTLEKILYIADYAEPSRPYDWCVPLRELVLRDLDAAVLYGLEVTINHTRKKEGALHPRTVEARDFLLAQRGAAPAPSPSSAAPPSGR